MSNPLPASQQKLLQDLSGSAFPVKRRDAAYQLSLLDASSEQILHALAVAAELDADPEVRQAAREALEAPVHQELLKANPGFVQKTARAAADEQAHQKQAREREIMDIYLRRRDGERLRYLAFFLFLGVSCVFFFLGLTNDWFDKWVVRLWQALVIGSAILFVFLSWRGWRCPSCNSWLGGFTFAINAVWTPSSVHCPHCGTKLS